MAMEEKCSILSLAIADASAQQHQWSLRTVWAAERGTDHRRALVLDEQYEKLSELICEGEDQAEARGCFGGDFFFVHNRLRGDHRLIFALLSSGFLVSSNDMQAIRLFCRDPSVGDRALDELQMKIDVISEAVSLPSCIVSIVLTLCGYPSSSSPFAFAGLRTSPWPYDASKLRSFEGPKRFW